MRFLSAGLFLVALGAAASAAEPSLEGDLRQLQGRWSARVGPGNDIRVDLDIDGRRANVVISTPQGLIIRARGLLSIDESSEPRALDWAEFTSMDGQRLPDIPAIYRIDEYGWTVCNGGPNGARPDTFCPGDGLLAGVVAFERTGTRKASVSTALVSESPPVAAR